MCLIIQKPKGLIVPEEKLTSAIAVNPDGFGLSYVDGSSLVTQRSPEKGAPDFLTRKINEELKDTDVLLHLRYTTVGETSLRNAHPFPILEKKTDGIDVRMAHNGTIHSYGSMKTGESDTREFVRKVIRPLFKNLKDVSEAFEESYLQELMEGFLPRASVLVFMDNWGRSLMVNTKGNGGDFLDDGVYYSNKYSFNTDHRTKSATNFTVTRNCSPNMKSGGVASTLGVGSKTRKFSDLMKVSPKDLRKMSDDTVNRISKNPYASSLLIKELLTYVQ